MRGILDLLLATGIVIGAIAAWFIIPILIALGVTVIGIMITYHLLKDYRENS